MSRACTSSDGAVQVREGEVSFQQSANVPGACVLNRDLALNHQWNVRDFVRPRANRLSLTSRGRPRQRHSSRLAYAVLSVVDLADDGVIGVAGDLGVRRPRPQSADGALVGSVTGCSAW